MSNKDSIQSLLKQASKKLESISDSAHLDAELLLAHCLGGNRTYLHTWPEKELKTTHIEYFNINEDIFLNIFENNVAKVVFAHDKTTSPFAVIFSKC